MKKNIILSILLLILLGSSIYYWQKTHTNNFADNSMFEWTEYKNDALGFSIHIPKMMLGLDRCSDRKFLVPTKVIENNENGEVYIVPEYYYFEKAEGSSDCKKVTYSLDQIKQDGFSQGSVLEPWLGIALRVKPVKNNKELEAFVQEKFGSDCRLGKKEFAKDEYSIETQNHISVISGGMESNCPLNYGYEVLFSDEAQKALAVNRGQECKFSASSDYAICYDDLILNSFQWKK